MLCEGDRPFAFLVEEPVLRNGLRGRCPDRQLGYLLPVGLLPNVSSGVVPVRPDRSRLPVEGFRLFDADHVNVQLVSDHLTVYGANARADHDSYDLAWMITAQSPGRESVSALRGLPAGHAQCALTGPRPPCSGSVG
ncbi:hypothetical protein [Streptomyces ziwulingensis]|uniref:Uncharacterized protein n=1 Tax=Streptomyces ziwulingensis TaxID=1045501 RepID=A0ABP9C8L6_9ACTN